jgi:uncharacterized protein YaiL (DUF2058 family)
MTDSLRNQLLGLGFKPSPSAKRDDRRGGKPKHQPSGGNRAGASGRKPDAGQASPKPQRPRGSPRSREDIDLAKAYAIRAQREKEERIAAEQAKQEEARKRREARARLAELVKGKALNAEDADIARHFQYGGKIKRVYVTAEQLKALNAGELGVLQMDGRYLLVTAELMAQAEQVFAPAVALKVDPDAVAGDDPYADPKYQVPDDLVW